MGSFALKKHGRKIYKNKSEYLERFFFHKMEGFQNFRQRSNLGVGVEDIADGFLEKS